MIDAKARVQAFHLKHSKDGPPVFFENQWRYPDGSFRSAELMGELVEPPPTTDPFELCSAIVLYHKARLAQAQNLLSERKDQLLHSLPNGDGKAELEELKKLRGDVEVAQAALRKAQQALEKTEVYQMRQGAKTEVAERNARIANWKSRVRVAAGAVDE